MCEYVSKNICSITDSVCPFMYFCTKDNAWRANVKMPKDCKVKLSFVAPKGTYLVRMVKGGYLYVDIGDSTYKIKNTLNYTPAYVKVRKVKGAYKIIE